MYSGMGGVAMGDFIPCSPCARRGGVAKNARRAGGDGTWTVTAPNGSTGLLGGGTARVGRGGERGGRDCEAIVASPVELDFAGAPNANDAGRWRRPVERAGGGGARARDGVGLGAETGSHTRTEPRPFAVLGENPRPIDRRVFCRRSSFAFCSPSSAGQMRVRKHMKRAALKVCAQTNLRSSFLI